MSPDTKLLAKAWIEYYTEYERTGKFPDSEASAVVDDLAHEDPEAALSVVLEILLAIDPIQENPLFQVLAAGPVEDLLSDHGPLIIGRVELLARREPAFNLLLGGVWKGGMSPDIWSRVEKCRLKTW